MPCAAGERRPALAGDAKTAFRVVASPERALVLALAVELVAFGIFGRHFLSLDNAFEVVRASVEIGLLALALTPVILTGGIDLSVGSLLAMSAVIFGAAQRTMGLPVWGAAAAAVATGCLGGALNGFLVTRLRLPPLIVTLGTYSLFRGLAEGLTGGVTNYTGFPEAFLALGQGRFRGGVPAQLPVLLAAAVGVFVLVHRSVVGRAWQAIGFSPEGARYAGLPVASRLRLAYVLSGIAAGVASLVYVARLGQAKADAGTGFELLAITAVVLGGTSIYGGRASVVGTLLGLLALAILQNGLRLSDQPAELAGILTGILLLLALGLSRERKAQ
jgi:ribose/xylose/arabinose/galactoside ABC-type transport system permease subunit